LINLVEGDKKLSIVISQEEKKAFGIQKVNTYHDVRKSFLGLPFEAPTVLHQTGVNRVEFHEFNRLRLLDALKQIRASQKGGALGFNFGAALSGATNAVSGIINVWKDITSAFKTVNSNTFKEKIPGEGFKYYKSHSRFIRSIGVPLHQWDKYTNSMRGLLDIKMNPMLNSKLSDLMELAVFVPDNAWNANDLTFDINKGGDCHSMVALTKMDQVDQRAHCLLTFVMGSFKLTPHILIYTKFKSIAGGIYEDTKDNRVEEPRGLTTEEIKAIHALMLLSALETMAQNLQIEFKLPELKTLF